MAEESKTEGADRPRPDQILLVVFIQWPSQLIVR